MVGLWIRDRITNETFVTFVLRKRQKICMRGLDMIEKLVAMGQQPVVKFVLQTLFYAVVLMILFYLYGYSGLGQGHFIYNEF